MVADLKDAIAGDFIDCGELVEATRLRLEMLDVHLNRLGPAARAAASALAGTAFEKRGEPGARVGSAGSSAGERDGMIPPEEEPQPRDPVLAFLSYPQDQRFDVRRGAKRTHPGPGQPGPQPVEALTLVPSAPFVEEGARNPEEPTRPG